MKKFFIVFVLLLCGCRAYNVPQYEEVDTFETGFLLPLEGDTSKQQQFSSESFLEERKIAVKRVQITKRWNHTGRMWFSGEWIPEVRLIKVDRKTTTREWTQSPQSGTSPNDDSIGVESRDSVAFRVGFTLTAYIDENDAAKFLYRYPSKSLCDVLDSEARARVTQCLSEVAAQYELNDVRSKKAEMMTSCRKDLLPFFKERGITITTMAIVGGFNYTNPQIQQAIDKTIQDQQLKVSREAEREAQEIQNKTIKLTAQSKAEAAREAARGEADAIKTVAEAKAYEIEKATVKDKELYLELKRLEIELERLKRWNGQYPQYFMQMGDGRMLVQPPAMPMPKKQ
jgi:hypothetical protein